MKNTHPVLLLVAALIFAAVFGIGCGTNMGLKGISRSTLNTAKPDEFGLGKRVLAVPLIDHAGIGEKKRAELNAALIETLGRDDRLILHNAEWKSPSLSQLRSPEFGIAVDKELAQEALEMGINIMISSVLNPLEKKTIKSGIWPFRSIKEEIEASLLVNAVNTINGTLLLTNLETEKIRVEKEQEEEDDPLFVRPKQEKEAEIPPGELDKVLHKLVERQSSILSEALRNHPWTGRILSVDGETVTIDAGGDTGLQEGMVFDVFGDGDSIICADGSPLILIGPKIGEIKAVQVMEHSAAAVPINGEAFQAGQIIRPKQ